MNPWQALIEPFKPPAVVGGRRHSADGYTAQAAAAFVVTHEPRHIWNGEPAVVGARLIPIIAIDFSTAAKPHNMES